MNRGSLESEIVSQRGKCLIYVCFASDPNVAHSTLDPAHLGRAQTQRL